MIVNAELAKSTGHINKDNWETPPRIFNALDDEFDFTLDPCCTLATMKCPKGYTPGEDGLKQNWQSHRCYVNPPYSRGNIDLWVEKCYTESLKYETKVVALLPVSTSSNWWHTWIVGKAELRFVDKRIRFVGAPFTAPFSSVIVIWGSSGIKSFKQ